MNDKRTKIEIIAPTIEEAIERGLLDLGVSRASVDVEVLDEGSKGLFGLGTRQARVQLVVKTSPVQRPDAVMELAESEAKIAPATQEAEEPPSEPSSRPAALEDDYVLDIARDVVKELLERMKIRAMVTAEYGKAEDARSRIPVLVNVNGDDLSYLIGRNAETLNALQYISNLIISKEIGRSIPLIVDVEGYRLRRENQLRQIARRMADQAVNTGRRQVLEPMPANERRIIHLELRDNPQVTTESVGEEPRRKVTIIPGQAQ
jgi:spoIIIJ-associated protein